MNKFSFALILLAAFYCVALGSSSVDSYIDWVKLEINDQIPDITGDFVSVKIPEGFVIVPDGSQYMYVYDSDEQKIYTLENDIKGLGGSYFTAADGFIYAAARDLQGETSGYIELFKWDRESKQFEAAHIGSFNADMQISAIAVHNSKIYLFGDKIWGANFDGSSVNGEWELLAEFTKSAGGSSISASIQSNGEKYLFYIFVANQKGIEAFSFEPETRRVSSLAVLPVELREISSAALGQSHIVISGKAENRIFAYHTITDTFCNLSSIPQGDTAVSVVSGSSNRFTLLTQKSGLGISLYQGTATTLRGGFKSLDYAAVIFYMLGMIAIGWYFSRKKGDISDFFLGGGRIPGWAAGLSLLATQVSSIGFMAIPAKAYVTNWLYIGTIIGWFFTIPIVIRYFIPFFRTIKVATAYEYLERRFSGSVRSFAAVLFSLVMITRMAVVLYLPSLALSAVTGIDKHLCIIIAGVICTIYTTMGGIEAVVWTDVVQVLVMLGSIITCIMMVMFGIDGGPSKFFSTAVEFNKFEFVNFDWNFATATIWVMLIGSVMGKISALTSDQSLIQRYSTTKNIKQTTKSLWTDAFVSIPWAFLVFFLGTALFVYYRINPQKLSPAVTNDAIVPWFVAQSLPIGVAGIVIAGLFAAAQSTLSSTLNSVSMTIVTDFYKRICKNATDVKMLVCAKMMTVLLGAVGTASALLMASAGIKSLWDFFIQMTGLFAGGLAALFALGIFTKRANAIGAMFGAITSAIVMLIVQKYTSMHVFFYTVVGYGWCFITGYIISSITGGNSKPLNGLTYYTRDKQQEV